MRLYRSVAWIERHIRLIRAVIVAVTLLSLVGPWAFDQINVPSEFVCSKPFIRLEGDFCGLPMSGIKIIAPLFGLFLGFPAGFQVSEASLPDVLSDLLAFCWSMLILLPVILELVSLLSRRKERLKSLRAIAWTIAISLAVLYGFVNPGTLVALWGPWLYVFIGLGGLAIDLSLFIKGTRA